MDYRNDAHRNYGYRGGRWYRGRWWGYTGWGVPLAMDTCWLRLDLRLLSSGQ